MKKNVKEEIKIIENMITLSKNAKQLHNMFELGYTRISNNGEEYNKKYDLQTIMFAKTIKELEKIYDEKSGIVVEIVDYKTDRDDFVIIYNEFNEYEQTDIAMYILK